MVRGAGTVRRKDSVTHPGCPRAAVPISVPTPMPMPMPMPETVPTPVPMPETERGRACMDQRAMGEPRLLLYHDLTQRGSIPAEQAAERFAMQLGRIASMGFRFATMTEYLAGELGPRDVVVTFDDALQSFHQVAWPILLRLSVSPTLFVVSEFAARTDARGTLMSWNDVHEVAASGATIGCHAASHVPLDQIPPEQMRSEITHSLAAFAEQGLPTTTLAYPFGRYNEDVKSVAETAGFEAAFTVMKGGADRFEIRRRLLTGAENPAVLRLMLSDGFFTLRDAARGLIPRRYLKQEQPIAQSRWGAQALGLAAVKSAGPSDGASSDEAAPPPREQLSRP